VYDDRFDDQYLDTAEENEPAPFDIQMSDMLPVVKVPSVHDHLIQISSSSAMPKIKKKNKASPKDKARTFRGDRADSSLSKGSNASNTSKMSMSKFSKRKNNLRDSSFKSSNSPKMPKTFGKSYMNKTVNDFKSRAERNELIEPPRKLANFKKKIVHNDGLTDIQMNMYRAMMEKKHKKEKAIKDAEENRKLSMKSQRQSNAWGDVSISDVNNSMERTNKGSVAAIKLTFSAEEKNRSMIVERN